MKEPQSTLGPHPDPSLTFLAGGGEMGERIRSFDWAATPLGPPTGWPQSLKTSIRIMLMSRQPVWIGWGSDLLCFYNDPYFSIIGGKHPRALGKPAREVWHEIWDVIGPMLATAMGGDEGTYVESQRLIMERNGYPEETYYTFSYSPIPSDDGQPAGVFCANSDDTQRVIGQRELALLRDLASRTAKSTNVEEVCERSMAALETNPWDIPFAMLYLLTEDGEFACLTSASRLLGNHTLAPARAPLQNETLPFADVLASQKPHTLDIRDHSPGLPTGSWPQAAAQAMVLPLPAAGESTRGGFLVCGLNPYRLANETYVGFLNLVAGQIAAALSDAEAIDRDRNRLAAMAELDRAKTAFFANVSHEFRTPLTLMLGPLEALVSEDFGTLPPRVRLELETIGRNGVRLQKLVNALLDFSRLEAGRVQAKFTPTDFGSYTAELASFFRSAVERSELRFEVDSPSLPTEAAAYLDRDLWEKVVFNLISNAFKHTFEGFIRVSTSLSADGLKLTVSDTGTGICPQNLAHLFERFRRVEGAKSRSHEGSGIGLALVREIVELHGGLVTVQSRVDTADHGTTFVVSIPKGSAHLPADQVVEEPEAEEEMASERRTRDAEQSIANLVGPEEGLQTLARDHASGLPARSAGARVLVTDDNADMRLYIGRLLSETYQVSLANSGRSALKSIAADQPDLVITDVMMPEMDGFELIKEIRSDPKLAELPVIMLSARAGEESRIEGLDAGADDYLVKPFSSRELLARVDSALSLASLRNQTNESLRQSQRRLEDALGEAERLAQELEDKVRERTAELTQANEQLQGFTYSIAHDLRQQIRRISANASMIILDDGDSLNESSRTKLQRMVGGALQLSELVDDLLSYAQSGSATAHPEQVDIAALARDIAESLLESGQYRPNVKLTIHKTPMAYIDLSMARIILENLFENAFKYSSYNENPDIEFGFTDGAYFVRDNGVGFDMRYAHKLFLAFERLHSDTSIPGTGIGLANVKRLIDKHQGHVWADGQLGQGSTFWFMLPPPAGSPEKQPDESDEKVTIPR